ncbi:MAG: CHAT domain-containing protein [Prevotellaceae bacterium]|nr:CHAT domain-containing protein [Prevotellaceae bacterium]
MNRLTTIVLALFCTVLQTNAQNLSEADVSAKMTQAFELDKAGKKAEALALFLVVGENTQQQRNEGERQTYVCSQTMACQCYELLGKYEEGYELAKKLLQGTLNNEERKNVGNQYTLNGYMYACEFIKRNENGQTDYGRGRSILEEIKPYAEGKVKDYVLSKIPVIWYFEGADCFIMLKYEEALVAYNKALIGFQELGREKDVISVLKGIASAKYHLNDIEGSNKAYNEALTQSRKTGDISTQMDILQELWYQSSAVGDLGQAKIYAAAMDSLMEMSSDSKAQFTYYNKKGKEARSQEAYKIAEQWFLKGMAVAESEVRDTISANRYLSYTNLRDLYAAVEQYDNALIYARKALAEHQRLTPVNDYKFYLPYMAIAEIYKRKGDKKECFACVDSLFLSAPCMEEPKELCWLYITKAGCHATFGDYTEALADYKKADEILAIKYPQSDGVRITLLPLMGGTGHKLKNYAESERLYRLYAEQITKQNGENSMESINAQIYLANAEGFASHIDAGCSDYADAVNQLKDLMRKQLPYVSLQEREGFWKPLSSLFTNMTPYALKAKRFQDSFTESCYDALIMSKSFLLESERSLFDVVKKEGTEEDMRDYMRLTLMKNQIKEWEKDYAHNADSILSMSQRADQLAGSLAERCRSFGNVTSFMDIDYKAVKQALKPNEVLLDFTDYVSETTGRKYAAYIINKEDEYPLVKDLFAERQIDSLGINRPDMYYDMYYAPDVLKLLWKPLKDHITEGATVYYVPSQLLYQVSLESLPLADGSLLGSHYNFVRLSSARELVKTQSPALSVEPHSAVLYGGLQYDLQPTAMIEESKKYELSDLLVMRGDMVRGDSVFRELPASKQEILQVESLLKANKWVVISRMGMEGTEESFLSMHGKAPQVLQIATHGFYYTPERAETVDYLKGYSDAMQLSGIVLSGGNAAWLGKELPNGVLGGILTANNIARLDLSGTELVVLSACQSGQGKATSEGLYGLQRAFKKAGVGTIVMALWSVSDKVATEFMAAFYEQLASKQCQWDKRKAFDKTKSIIRDKYPEPFHWAAFVMLD